MRLQMSKINFSIIFLVSAAILSLSVMAKSGDVSKEAPIRTESKVIGAWQVDCSFGKNNQKLGCAAILTVTQKAAAKAGDEIPQESIVMLWQIGKSQNGNFVSTIQTPTGVVIKPGVQLKLTTAQAEVTLPFVSCDQKACFAGLVMDDYFLKKAVSEQKVNVVLQAVDSKVYTYSFYPKGIDKAMLAIK